MVNPESISQGGRGSISFLTALSADEILYSGFLNADNINEYSFNEILPENSLDLVIWSELYQYIYKANAILEGLQSSEGISDGMKSQLEGEAKFLRAFSFFYLFNLYGDIPLTITTDYEINTSLERSTKPDVYSQIISDLTDAKNLLPEDYDFSNNERVRANKFVASALLARVYLYNENWQEAETNASLVLNSSLYELTQLDQVFLTNSNEVIFQLGNPNDIAADGITFNYNYTGAYFSNALSQAFEDGDVRKEVWVDSADLDGTIYYWAKKYTGLDLPPVEYTTVLRLAEQYLIRAEARAHQNDLGNAIADLNTIRNRAGLPNLSNSLNQVQVLLAIEQERRVELFTEWGHRWLDIKRTNRADVVLSPLKGDTWQSTDVLYPIPQYQIQNSNLEQNPGY